MNKKIKERRNVNFKTFLVLLFFIVCLTVLWVFNDYSLLASEIELSSQEASQEQKPPEQKQKPPEERKKEETKTDEQLQDMIGKEEEILPDDILRNQSDPFRSPIEEAAEKKVKEGKIGAAAMSIEELSVIGIVQQPDGFIAMVTGPDNVGYFLRENDEVMNGRVIEITMEMIVFEQEITDPYALKKTRTITKRIHPEK